MTTDCLSMITMNIYLLLQDQDIHRTTSTDSNDLKFNEYRLTVIKPIETVKAEIR